MKTMNRKQNNPSHIPMSKLIYITIGSVIIVAGIAVILRLSKTMIGDLQELGL